MYFLNAILGKALRPVLMAILYSEQNIGPFVVKVPDYAEFASFAAWALDDLIKLNKSNF